MGLQNPPRIYTHPVFLLQNKFSVCIITEIALPYQSPVPDAFLFMLSNYAVLNFQDDQWCTMLKVISDVEGDRYIAVPINDVTDKSS